MHLFKETAHLIKLHSLESGNILISTPLITFYFGKTIANEHASAKEPRVLSSSQWLPYLVQPKANSQLLTARFNYHVYLTGKCSTENEYGFNAIDRLFDLSGMVRVPGATWLG